MSDPAATKKPLEIGRMLKRIERAVRPFPKAALFELAEEAIQEVRDRHTTQGDCSNQSCGVAFR